MAEKLASRYSLATPVIAQPDPQGHPAKLIRIRPYRPSDSEQVRELFKVGFVDARGALKVGYNAQLRGTTAFISCCALILGLILATFVTSTRIRYFGVAFSIAGCALFVGLRYRFTYLALGFLERALNGDLKDIDKTFGMKPIDNHNGESTGEYAPSGTSGFWVAEAYEEGSEIGDSRAEIIGSVGLNANNNSEETSAELCRMVVSPNYRRRGIALSLIKTALHHAKNRGVISVVLSTTMLHSAAVAMYEKFGWVLQKKIGLWIVLDRVWVVFYSLDLTTVNV